MSRSSLVLASSLIYSIIGCTQPLQGTGGHSNAWGLQSSLIAGDHFQHLIYWSGTRDKSSPVRIYLEGDGLPWVTRTRIARDPTPRTPLALGLMTRDPGPSLYLGRPCYHGLAHSPGCSPWLWTHGRYSDQVVTSMAEALRRALGPDMNRDLTLIGFSGGGVLAMLIAARMERVRQVVTIAANLDTDAWADHNGYSRLRGSLNPATQPPLPPHIGQIHLAGGQDLRVPAHLSRPVTDSQPNAQFLVAPDFDHRCCWERAWPSILIAIDKKGSALDPTTLDLDRT